jgi:hypothetical protein
LGAVTNEQFRILSGDYTAEQDIRIVYRDVDVMDSVEPVVEDAETTKQKKHCLERA